MRPWEKTFNKIATPFGHFIHAQTTTKLILMLTTVGLLFLFSSCGKSEHTDPAQVEVSERQLYSFSPSGAGFSYSFPTLVDNFIYIGTSTGYLYEPSTSNYFYKLDQYLNKVWEYSLVNKQLRGAASLDSYGNIYFVVESYEAQPTWQLFSLDNNGNYRWSKDIVKGGLIPGMMSLAIAEDNTIYAGGDDFFAFDINGTIKWTYDNYLVGTFNNAPIIDTDGNIYFCANGWVFSLDKDGNERWLFQSGEIDGNSLSSLAFTTDYSHVIITEWKSIYSRETSTGNLSWQYTFDMNATFRATPVVDDNNIIYIGSHGNGDEKDESTMYALKADGSGIIWQYHLGSDMYSSPTLGNDRVLYVGSEGYGNTSDKQNRLHAFDMANGEILWSAQLSNDVLWGSPILSDEGILYVATAYIKGEYPSGIYAFQTDATGLLSNCGSPTFQLSNAHTGRK